LSIQSDPEWPLQSIKYGKGTGSITKEPAVDQ